MKFILEIALILCWALMAAWQANLIKKQRPIKHGWWAALSGVLIAGATWKSELQPWWPMVAFAGMQGIARLVVFNVLLNLFRGEKWNYYSATSGSILDKIEIALYGVKAWVLEVGLAIIFILYNIFFL